MNTSMKRVRRYFETVAVLTKIAQSGDQKPADQEAFNRLMTKCIKLSQSSAFNASRLRVAA